MMNSIKRKIREWKTRMALAKHALKGTDFIVETTPGFRLTRTRTSTSLPDYHESAESDERAALLGRATEDAIRYVAFRDLREAWEDKDSDLFKAVGEMAGIVGYDGDMHRAIRLLEEKYRDRAVSNIQKRLVIDDRPWEESGVTKRRVVRDPRLNWKMEITTSARDHVKNEGSGPPPHVIDAANEAAYRVLEDMVGADRGEVKV